VSPALTPGGPRPPDQVRPVPPGARVRRLAAGRYEVEGAEHVLVPGGLRPRDKVHAVPPGHRLQLTGDRLAVRDHAGAVVAEVSQPERSGGAPLMPGGVVRPVGATPTVDGWITYASWSNATGTPVSRFSTTWVVPPEPTARSGQTVFLFNGIQNSTAIYQPVLQWGSSAAGGGEFWSVASWYVDGPGGFAFHSNLTRVAPGDVLTGVMTLSGSSPAGSSYDCSFTGLPDSGLPVTDIEELTWCVQTLECYSITGCSDYPDVARTAMAGIELTTGSTRPTLTWAVNDAHTECGQHTAIFSEDAGGSGEVDLWYRSAPYWTSGFGTLAPGASQDWWFSWGGDGDVGPQLVQAQPVDISGELSSVTSAESRDTGGHLTYYATVRNDGANPVRFQWRGGGR
jgi:hypothetical protein